MENLKKYLFFLVFMLLAISNYGQQNQWENIGPFMGYINSMEMDLVNSDTVYAGTQTGLFKTVDGAENWFKTSLPNIKVNTVEVSLSNPNKIICSTDYSVFLSSDYGDSWNLIWSDTMKVTCATFNPKNPNSILLGTNEYLSKWNGEVIIQTYTEWIYKSLNSGKSWRKFIYTMGFKTEDWTM
jgi:hypothetical protein